MAIHIIVFNVLLASMCTYAVLCGGRPEKLAALGWAAGCLATFMLPATDYRSVRWDEVAIDLAVLGLFVGIAAFANRFWPMWLAATHLLAMSVHGVKAYQPDLLPAMYAFALSKISYPMLLLITIGIARHQARVRLYGGERDWSFSPAAAA